MEVDLDSMDVLNEVRYEISQLSKESRYEFECFVWEQPGIISEIWDEDYLNFFRSVLGKPDIELEDDGGLHCKELSVGDLNGDDHFENSVAESVHDEDLDDDGNVVNSVGKSEHEDLDDDDGNVENSVGKTESDYSDDDERFINSIGKSENENSDDDDPQYKIFLSHLKGNGKSFTFEMKDESGLLKIFEYQKEKPIDDACPSLKTNSNVNSVAERTRSKSRTRCKPKISKNVKRSCLRSASLGKNNIQSHNKHTLRKQTSRSKPKSKGNGLGKMGEEQHEKSINIRSHEIKKEQESSFEGDLFEGDYMGLLSSAEIGAGRIELPPLSDEILVYDREVDLCGEVTSLGPSSSRKNNVDDDDDDGCQILDDCFESDPLREKVMAILRKPFDGQEYKTLWHDITQKKYKLRHRELRDNRELSVPTDIKAKSYLEQHEDLRRRIEAVPDNKYRELNILRGFFFWLQHAAWGISFKPWEDASCLAVMPGSH